MKIERKKEMQDTDRKTRKKRKEGRQKLKKIPKDRLRVGGICMEGVGWGDELQKAGLGGRKPFT